MKIFTLITLNRVEDSESVTLKHFHTKEEALAALKEAAENDVEDLKKNDLIEIDEDGEEEGSWQHDDIVPGMKSYSSWEDGYECHNHFSLSIVEADFS